MIEPAAYGAAVCFGPNTRNFQDIVRLLLGCGGAQVVHNGSELTAFVRDCLENTAAAAEMGHRAQQLVKAQHGASDRTIQSLRAVLTLPTEGREGAAA